MRLTCSLGVLFDFLNQVVDAVHDMFLNRLSICMVVFNIVKLLHPDTQEQVGCRCTEKPLRTKE